MHNYIVHYTIPVLVIMAILLAVAKIFGKGKEFYKASFVAVGFLLGWASAYLSLYYFQLYK